ncbi:Gfo/Idh/MocA family protein [Dermatobacter hominis]|uniref:Gfo/Idh/MocA family protein n=1 Tax=Dermatobacter hominis TaxID=2884263 RepID=UPI001D103CA1|nr:Gfo/Idh/MocA family oxidoreductase [Dermatobacter hominis]UDY34984.1 Gfo/Idh/MocA family oxidoreductase [Dermatobacter hominis]
MVRWGVIGPGGIATRFGNAMTAVDDGEIVAVSSRSIDRARDYADRFGVASAYEGVDDLLADDRVDVVYVATPHSRHEADSLAALAAGKPVLCEKAFALDAAQASRMVEAARAAGLFLMEALWSRFLPGYRRLRELLDEGAIGDPLLVEADFGFQKPFDPAHRLFDLAQGGGALLDLGIYPVQLCTFVLGLPDRVVADGVVGPSGADETVAALLHHRHDRLGVVKASTQVPMACTARIAGTQGWVDIPAFMHHPDSLAVHGAAGTHTLDTAYDGDGLRFEIEEVHRCLAAGALESPVMPLDESIALMRILDDIRAQIGVVYPGL